MMANMRNFVTDRQRRTDGLTVLGLEAIPENNLQTSSKWAQFWWNIFWAFWSPVLVRYHCYLSWYTEWWNGHNLNRIISCCCSKQQHQKITRRISETSWNNLEKMAIPPFGPFWLVRPKFGMPPFFSATQYTALQIVHNKLPWCERLKHLMMRYESLCYRWTDRHT